MTADAGQTSTKNPIVNNKRNNDSSRKADRNSVILLTEIEHIAEVPDTGGYLEAVPVPAEW